MFIRLGAFVSRHWLMVLLIWCTVLTAVCLCAPDWDDVTHDGDFAYLPFNSPSAVGQRLTNDAFPSFEAKSQVVLVVARDSVPLDERDFQIADYLAHRFHNLLGVAQYGAAKRHRTRYEQLQSQGQPELAAKSHEAELRCLAAAERALNEAIRLTPDQGLEARPEWGIAWHNRSLLKEHLGLAADSRSDRETAWRLSPELRQSPPQMLPDVAVDLPLVDVWTRDNKLLGSKMVSRERRAVLVILQLRTEFMATGNLDLLESVQGALDEAQQLAAKRGIEGLRLGRSGSATVGGDMLQSTAESIANTELYTVTLVIAILLIVYRAPLLILVPLTTIAVALTVSTGLLAILTPLSHLPGMEWFKIFKTTKIFVVVILFGAGTDFCLFLIARFREELKHTSDRAAAVARAVSNVGEALSASAFTTMLGLGMMFFAAFGKFRSSGPAIAICIAVTLIACLTLAPALLRALGPAVFWPWRAALPATENRTVLQLRRTASSWSRLASLVVSRPGPILVACLLGLSPLAVAGFLMDDHVTFDLLSELESDRPSIVGNAILEKNFPIGEAGPVIVLAHRTGAGFGQKEGGHEALDEVQNLTKELLKVDGVTAVRSLSDPLGDPPQRTSLFRAASRKKLFLREHRLTKSIFVAQAPGFAGDVTRFELVLDADPFSKRAVESLNRIEQRLQEETGVAQSFWSAAEFAFTGTTAAIRDLRTVTQADQRRIQVLVVCAVLAVLLYIFRDVAVCLYLVASVVFSYLVTIGACELFFQWAYGDTFQGLDWKVPVFLFVILVAIGEDYNIYLVTRVFEEQSERGPFAGIRTALVKTGGIITSCGVIMAGTFVSMTTGSLRGIVELGFALSLGVLLDTFVVRTVLVPAFLALLYRWRMRKRHAEMEPESKLRAS